MSGSVRTALRRVLPVLASVLLALCFTFLLYIGWLQAKYPCRLGQLGMWNIGLAETFHPNLARASLQFSPLPALSCIHVVDAPADFVADPFIIRAPVSGLPHDEPDYTAKSSPAAADPIQNELALPSTRLDIESYTRFPQQGRWFMFFEVLNRQTDEGDIGVAWSDNPVTDGWHYQQIVLDEPFHLSYPFVFAHENAHFMVPESNEARAVRLYRATFFPSRWTYVRDLVLGQKFIDTSLVFYSGLWYLFTHVGPGSLLLYVSDSDAILTASFHPHPMSPLYTGSDRLSRPGGRPVVLADGSILRFSQNSIATYGRAVVILRITTLSPEAFQEEEVREIEPRADVFWMSQRVHHMDPHWVDGDGVEQPPPTLEDAVSSLTGTGERTDGLRWVVAVDGNYNFLSQTLLWVITAILLILLFACSVLFFNSLGGFLDRFLGSQHQAWSAVTQATAKRTTLAQVTTLMCLPSTVAANAPASRHRLRSPFGVQPRRAPEATLDLELELSPQEEPDFSLSGLMSRKNAQKSAAPSAASQSSWDVWSCVRWYREGACSRASLLEKASFCRDAVTASPLLILVLCWLVALTIAARMPLGSWVVTDDGLAPSTTPFMALTSSSLVSAVQPIKAQAPLADDESIECPVTIVTALYDINYGDAETQRNLGLERTQGWEDYLAYFRTVLNVNSCMSVHVAASDVPFVLSTRHCLYGTLEAYIGEEGESKEDIATGPTVLAPARLMCQYPTEIVITSLAKLREYHYFNSIRAIVEDASLLATVRRPGRIEKKLPEYNLLMFYKVEWLNDVAKRNPHHSRYLFWMDGGFGKGTYFNEGVFRHHRWPDLSQVEKHVGARQIFLVKTERTLSRSTCDDPVAAANGHKVAFAGGFFGGARGVLAEFYTEWNRSMRDLFEHKLMDDDQFVLWYTYCRRSDMFTARRCTHRFVPFQAICEASQTLTWGTYFCPVWLFARQDDGMLLWRA